VQGDTLIELVNHELEQEWEKTIGQLHETSERLDGSAAGEGERQL
jgi:hypothetical protein